MPSNAFWISTRPDFVGEVSQAGAFVRHQGMGKWWASTPKNTWPIGPDFDSMIEQHWNKDFGDRRQEIVLIGLSAFMDEKKIREQLDECLIKDYLKSKEAYQQILDPFPNWFQKQPEIV